MEKKNLNRVYGEEGPEVQDQYEISRDKLFSSLFRTLKDEGIFSRLQRGCEGRGSKSIVYFPASNRQRETIIFSSLSDGDDSLEFIGGDMVEKLVHEGKGHFSASGDGAKNNNMDFVAADGCCIPFKNDSLEAIVDIAGAGWYVLDADTGEEAASNLKSIFYEWYRVLGEGGCVVLDDFHHYWPNGHIQPENYSGKEGRYESTVHRIEKKAPDIFESIKNGEFRFQTDEGSAVAFKTRPVKLKNGNGRVYVFEKRQ